MKFNASISTILALGLAALAKASPTNMPPVHLASRDVTPPKDQEFSLAMTIDGTYVSLTATYLGENNIILQAGRLSAYPGTPSMSFPFLSFFLSFPLNTPSTIFVSMQLS